MNRCGTYGTNFCNQFLSDTTSMIIELPVEGELLRNVVCSAMSVMQFERKLFCLAGTFKNGKKNDLGQILRDLGGSFQKLFGKILIT